MSEPFIPGQVIYKAFWTRSGACRVAAGKVALASAQQCIVEHADGTSESVSQLGPGGWCATREAALEHLLCRLGVALSRAEGDVLTIRARILNTKTMLAHVAGVEAGS
jgi:hypothetical protein